MRICFISRRYFPAISGMSVYAQNLLGELVDAGHRVTMISQYRNDCAGAGIYGGGPPPPVAGVEVIGLESLGEQRVGFGEPADFEADLQAMVAAALEAHRRQPFDIVHAQYGYPNGLAALEVSRQLGIPNVVSIQGGDGHWVGTCCQTHKAAMLAVLNHAGALLIGSRSFAEEVHGHHGVAVERFTIVPGATATKRFYPLEDRPLGAAQSVPVLLYHGRVDWRKGVGELLGAMALLRDRGRAVKLLVSGIGPDVDGAVALTAELALGDRVEFTGYADYAKAPDVYRRGDIFVSPTYSEGFSNTILEAMASGLPVVSTDTVGVVDCLRQGENGLLVAVRDVEGLAAAVEHLLDDGELRQRLAAAALDEVETRYSWRAVGALIQDIYGQLAGTTPDNRWWQVYGDLANMSREDADLSCRFRRDPHLL
ncbi:MAG: glycosyltransferase family 4 protein [Candidatus Competibacterales bacterium]